MAYARLDSPLPYLTARLGDATTDPTLTDPSTDPIISDPGTIIDPTGITDPIQISPIDPIQLPTDLPISPVGPETGGSVYVGYPDTIGTEFTSNGDGTYTNIQTGQSVPYLTALQVSAATISPTGLSTTSLIPSTNGTTLTDPTTGTVYTYDSATGQFNGSNGATNGLTAAGQALAAAGQLITAAGKLTAQAQSLAMQGGLMAQPQVQANYAAQPQISTLSTQWANLVSWFSEQTIIGGVPNSVIVGGGIVALAMLGGMGGKKRRR